MMQRQHMSKSFDTAFLSVSLPWTIVAGSGKPAEQCDSSTLGMILQENSTAAEEEQAFAYTASWRTRA